VSTSLFFGILCFSAALSAQIPPADPHAIQPSDAFSEWPESTPPEPIAGVVSLGELQHPVSKKALQAAYDAQQLSRANKIPQAIAKLEKAIRIDPSYRDAHWNLGVQYTRVGRLADARTEFQKALEIGPPAAPLLADLAFASAAAGEFPQAEALARKALELDPENSVARLVLKDAPR
jgi:tetratricopeptide (TPR) repeat protein